MKKILRLGTRGSPLALIQAEDARTKLLAAHAHLANKIAIEIVPIRTSGDWRPADKERTFLDIGGDKSLFTKEIEEALLDGTIDFAVHSMKDVQSHLPKGLAITVLMPRADPRDAFIANSVRTLEELPPGATVGTSSLRRQAQLLAKRPDLKVVPLRGNVDTRLKKLANGDVDATVLAIAGMERLGLAGRASSILEPEVMLPSAGQGALGIEIREDDHAMAKFLKPLHCATTAPCVHAERAFLIALDGSCSTPIGALARFDHAGRLQLEALAAKPDGTVVIRMNKTGEIKDAVSIGQTLGEEMKQRLPPDFFARPA